MLAHLSPGRLQLLHLFTEGVDAAAMKELRRFTRLTQLSIKCQRAMDGCVTAALPSLPQLQHLQLNGRSLPAGLPAALRHLSQLTRLSCRSREQLPGLSAVLALSRLRMLGTWEEERWDGMLQPDVHEMLARLQHLESWAFESLGKEEYTGSMQVGGLGLLVRGLRRAAVTAAELLSLGWPAASHAWRLRAVPVPLSLSIIWSIHMPGRTTISHLILCHAGGRCHPPELQRYRVQPRKRHGAAPDAEWRARAVQPAAADGWAAAGPQPASPAPQPGHVRQLPDSASSAELLLFGALDQPRDPRPHRLHWQCECGGCGLAGAGSQAAQAVPTGNVVGRLAPHPLPCQ